MELIYFISGILTAGVVYGVSLLRHVKSSHADLLNKYDKSTSISSLRHSEVGEMVDDMKLYVNDIQDKLSKDSYSETIKLSEQLNVFTENIEDRLNVLEKKVNDDIKLTDKSFNKVFTEIQAAKNSVKALGENPNFLSKY